MCISFLHTHKKCLFSIPLSYVVVGTNDNAVENSVEISLFLHFPSSFWPARENMTFLTWPNSDELAIKKDTISFGLPKSQDTLNVSKKTRISSVVSA